MQDRIIEFLEQQPDQHATRPAVQRALNITPLTRDEYIEAEQALVDRDKIEVRRGRHGGIYLMNPAMAVEQLDSDVNQERQRERSHYEAALSVLTKEWVVDEKFSAAFGCVTAGGGRRSTGGRWTRPDITLLCISKRIFDSRQQGDIRTFEIKLYEALDVSAVFEALSHRARSHYAYLLVVNYPLKQTEEDEDRLERVVSEAARHGVGLIVASSTSKYETWQSVLDARLSDADPIAIEDFVVNQVDHETRQKFTQKLNSIEPHGLRIVSDGD